MHRKSEYYCQDRSDGLGIAPGPCFLGGPFQLTNSKTTSKKNGNGRELNNMQSMYIT